ncbi:MAG: GxxExxY protein [Bacteroidota bacterium]
MSELIYKEEAYKIIGVFMEVHKQLGKGFSEIVYKDAIEYEFKIRKYPYEREKQYEIKYKNIILPHKFFADFVVFDKIVLEVKSSSGIADEFLKLTLNYLAASKCKLGLIVNFGKDSLEYKRVVL